VDSLGMVISRSESAVFNSCGNNLPDIRFDDGTLASIYHVDLCPDRIDTDDLMTVLGEAPRRHRSNVAQTEDADFQNTFLSLMAQCPVDGFALLPVFASIRCGGKSIFP